MKFIGSVFLVFFMVLGMATLISSHEAQAQQAGARLNSLGFVDVTIPSGQTTSAAFDTGAMNPVGLFIPASFTGTAITYTVAQTRSGTYSPVRDSANAVVTTTVTAGAYQALSHIPFYGVRYMKLVSGSAEAADRVVRVQLKSF